MQYVKLGNGINEVRNLVNTMTEGANIVYHFKDFDTASVQAKNALLKITEETPAGNYIIVTGSRQIPTLESRARKLVMAAYSQEEMSDYLGKYYIPELVPQLYIAGINTPAKVNKYKEYEFIEQLMYYAYDIYGKLTGMSIDVVVLMLSKFETKYDKLDPCVLFLDMLINIVSYNIKNRLNYKYSYYNILNILIECKEDIIKEPTLNRKFMLYQTFYQIKELGGQI